MEICRGPTSRVPPIHATCVLSEAHDELSRLRAAHEELKTEFRSQAKELTALRRRVYDAEAISEKAAGAIAEAEALKAKLLPLIASLKKDAAEVREACGRNVVARSRSAAACARHGHMWHVCTAHV